MRTDAVAVILEVVARMRQLEPRLKVTWETGWEGLGNGLAARYVGGIVHDTTTPSSPAKPFPTQHLLRVGRPDLSGPITNFGGPYCTVAAPWIHVTAAFPANHAGASGGRSMGPLPRTSLFNPTVLGLEIDFSGLALMPAGQMYVGHLWARAVADVLAGGNLEYVRAHFETSVTGKIDISYAAGKSYDMAAFRRDAAALTLEDDMTPDQAAQLARVDALLANSLAPALGRVDALLADSLAPAIGRLEQRQVGYGQRTERTEATVTELADTLGLASGSTTPAPGGQAIDYDRLAAAIVDEQDRRARDGNPATGPVS